MTQKNLRECPYKSENEFQEPGHQPKILLAVSERLDVTRAHYTLQWQSILRKCKTDLLQLHQAMVIACKVPCGAETCATSVRPGRTLLYPSCEKVLRRIRFKDRVGCYLSRVLRPTYRKERVERAKQVMSVTPGGPTRPRISNQPRRQTYCGVFYICCVCSLAYHIVSTSTILKAVCLTDEDWCPQHGDGRCGARLEPRR